MFVLPVPVDVITSHFRISRQIVGALTITVPFTRPPSTNTHSASSTLAQGSLERYCPIVEHVSDQDVTDQSTDRHSMLAPYTDILILKSPYRASYLVDMTNIHECFPSLSTLTFVKLTKQYDLEIRPNNSYDMTLSNDCRMKIVMMMLRVCGERDVMLST